MATDSLRFLLRDDRRLLEEKARRVAYRSGEEVIAEGSAQQALYVVRRAR